MLFSPKSPVHAFSAFQSDTQIKREGIIGKSPQRGLDRSWPELVLMLDQHVCVDQFSIKLEATLCEYPVFVG